MRRFLIHYWDDMHAAKWYTKIKSKREAVKKFRELKGDKFILAVEEAPEGRYAKKT